MSNSDYRDSFHNTSSLRSLLDGKVRPPIRNFSVVKRTGLEHTFRDVTKYQLTLLSAPAGFGKTTHMIEIHRHLLDKGDVVAWLSLDNNGNTPNSLLNYIFHALQKGGLLRYKC